MKIAYLIPLVIGLILTAHTAHGGKLSRARDAVRSSSTSSPKSQSKPSRSDKDDDDDDDDDSGILSSIGNVVRSVSSSDTPRQKKRNNHSRNNRPHRSPRSPRIALFASSDSWCEPAYPAPIIRETIIYPETPVEPEYVYTPPAVTQVDPPFSEPVVPISTVEPVRKRLEILYGNDLGDVNAFGAGLLLQQPSGLGLDTNLRLFREDYLDQRDHLWLGDANLTYELINEPRFQVRAGIGMGWLTDAYGGNAGLNLTLASDLYVTPSLVLSGELDFGSINDADMLHARASVGYLIERVELFAGYDHYDIGGVEINSLMSGIRFRF